MWHGVSLSLRSFQRKFTQRGWCPFLQTSLDLNPDNQRPLAIFLYTSSNVWVHQSLGLQIQIIFVISQLPSQQWSPLSDPSLPIVRCIQVACVRVKHCCNFEMTNSEYIWPEHISFLFIIILNFCSCIGYLFLNQIQLPFLPTNSSPVPSLLFPQNFVCSFFFLVLLKYNYIAFLLPFLPPTPTKSSCL